MNWVISMPVQPDLPAQAPGAQRGRFPVVLHEADVVLVPVDADRLQAAQVELLRVARVGLEDHLELGVHLHAVGVFGVAAVVGPVAGLDIGDVPRFWTQHAQTVAGLAGARAHLLAVGLPEQAAMLGPVVL